MIFWFLFHWFKCKQESNKVYIELLKSIGYGRPNWHMKSIIDNVDGIVGNKHGGCVFGTWHWVLKISYFLNLFVDFTMATGSQNDFQNAFSRYSGKCWILADDLYVYNLRNIFAATHSQYICMFDWWDGEITLEFTVKYLNLYRYGHIKTVSKTRKDERATWRYAQTKLDAN